MGLSAQQEQDEELSNAMAARRRSADRQPEPTPTPEEEKSIGAQRLARMRHQNAQLLGKKLRKG